MCSKGAHLTNIAGGFELAFGWDTFGERKAIWFRVLLRRPGQKVPCSWTRRKYVHVGSCRPSMASNGPATRHLLSAADSGHENVGSQKSPLKHQRPLFSTEELQAPSRPRFESDKSGPNDSFSNVIKYVLKSWLLRHFLASSIEARERRSGVHGPLEAMDGRHEPTWTYSRRVHEPHFSSLGREVKKEISGNTTGDKKTPKTD